MSKIFISYRREDSAYVASMLAEKLSEQFGEGSVFYDIDNIPFGVDFRDHINDAVSQCDALLAIIGDSWLNTSDAGGNRRIDNPTDFVRLEIEAALHRNIRVVPVLVGQAQMPSEQDLPDAIKLLSYRNAAELRSGRDLRYHIETLVKGLGQSLEVNKVPREDKHEELEKEPAGEESAAEKRIEPVEIQGKLENKLETKVEKPETHPPVMAAFTEIAVASPSSSEPPASDIPSDDKVKRGQVSLSRFKRIPLSLSLYTIVYAFLLVALLIDSPDENIGRATGFMLMQALFLLGGSAMAYTGRVPASKICGLGILLNIALVAFTSIGIVDSELGAWVWALLNLLFVVPVLSIMAWLYSRKELKYPALVKATRP